MPGVYFCGIVEKKMLADGIFQFTVFGGEMAREARAGQFLHIRCGGERILRRPISIAGVMADSCLVTFVIDTVGAGTKWLAGREIGDTLDILGPLGRGFDLPSGSFAVVGGGVGVPPLLFAACCAEGGVTAVLGFRDENKMMLVDDFEAVCDKVFVTTDNGGYGIHGTVMQPLERLLKDGRHGAVGAVLTCGPHAMMSAVAKLCRQFGILCQASLEERMGCGVGACLVCACKTVSGGIERMSHVCKDGPVFDAAEVVW